MIEALTGLLILIGSLLGVSVYRNKNLKKQHAEEKEQSARKQKEMSESLSETYIEAQEVANEEISNVKNSDIDLDHFTKQLRK